MQERSEIAYGVGFKDLKHSLLEKKHDQFKS